MNVLYLKRFFPVIHCVDPFNQQGIAHALRNTKIAMENFADGVFLIGHKLGSEDLFSIYEQVRKQFPTIWIGINFLDVTDNLKLENLVKKCGGLNAVWIDNLPQSRLNIPSSVSVFGGVAFKYIDPDIRGKELKDSCDRAKELVDVTVTSGTKTGGAPDIAKIKEIRKNIGDSKRLALASGVTLKNVSLFLPIVSDYLVASSIIEKRKDLGSHDYFIPEKVLALAMQIHS